MTTVAFFYDIVCPYAYIASTRVHAVCSRHGGRVAPRPILLGGVYQAVGTPSLPQRQMPAAKAAWLARDIALCAEMYGVPLRFPAGHPRRSVEAMRLILAAPEATRWPLTEAIYSAYWAEGRDIADTAVLADVARSVGLDGDALVEIIATPAAKEALRARTAEAVAAGVFGVPTFIVGDHLIWGQDRLDLVEHLVAGGRLPARPDLAWRGKDGALPDDFPEDQP